MNLIVHKLFRNLFTLAIVTLLITLLVSLPKDFNFNYSFSYILQKSSLNLADIKHSLLGMKNFNGIPVKDIMLESFVRSSKLIFSALALSLVAGVLKGVIDFNIKKQDTSLYRLLHTLFMLSVPDILVIIFFRMLIRYIEQKFGFTLLPVLGYKSAKNLVLPVITLSIVPIVFVARATTTSLRQIYKKPFMLVAKAKGLSDYSILLKHGLRNCFNTIFDTSIGAFNIIMSSLLIVEIFYYYPGVTIQMLEFYQRGFAYMFIIYAFSLGLLFVFLDLIIELMKIYSDPERHGEIIG